MQRTIDRRQLLATAALGGVVGATGLGSLAPEAAFAAEAVTVEPGLPDPNFAEGRITAVSGSMLFVTGSDAVLHAIRITDGTSIWKLHPTTFDRVATGDGLYARGVRLPDGTLAADSVWVNIVNLHAHIASVGRNMLNLDHKGQRIVAHVVPNRSAAVYNGTPAVSDLSLLRVGRHVQVLGAWHPGTNEIDIATVYAAA
ncbi:twin-arginine translocation signal domain-containing protein [Micromonospora krabiensis]|uniref:Tat (Twin-arginine translocation) pathway signal sequence n=1 Tax=Micromonospora krabiensis TaxID=307121 RepID=A0A1C3N2V4_9ACTN|nr:twin-arginine translocation signal domain-containing protein [Micromonospora krabiensis]SBV26910.1 Tat (twin-arginine translocation) pathway signal sequence [Micromonospora krabiensis]